MTNKAEVSKMKKDEVVTLASGLLDDKTIMELQIESDAETIENLAAQVVAFEDKIEDLELANSRHQKDANKSRTQRNFGIIIGVIGLMVFLANTAGS